VKEHGYEKAISVAAEGAVDLAFKGKESGALVFKAASFRVLSKPQLTARVSVLLQAKQRITSRRRRLSGYGTEGNARA
jgi:hypothetical protein